jgi:AraC-like DNA-binding protein
MEAVSSPEELFTAPGGRYFARRRFVYVRVDPTLSALLAWGRVEEPDARELADVLVAEETSGIPPHGSLLHFQHVEWADNLAVHSLGTYMMEHADAQAKVISREAVVRPEGTIGMLVAGFYEVVSPPYPVAVFATPAEALEWLSAAPGTLPLLDEILNNARLEAGLIAALRDLLSTERVDVSTAARRLGVSERTLQRRLHEAGSSFRGELAGARLRVAQNLLLSDPTLDIKAIAAAAGFASTQSFARVFRDATGTSPTEWRTRELSRR